MINGIVNVDKPAGLTSSDVVYRLRKIFSTRAVGHMGTLDPQGTGVLPIGIGKSTRLFDYLLKKDKVYRTTFSFGCETDTLDGEGEIISRAEKIPSLEEFTSTANNFIKKYCQIPPAYSAKNIGGVRAYELARAGKPVTLLGREVEIYNIYAIEKNNAEFTLTVNCSSGTYIRSLCRDIAHALDSLAIMTSIRRLRAGIFKVENAYSLDEIAQLKEKAVIPPQKCLDIPQLVLDEGLYKSLVNGMSVRVEGAKSGECFVSCRGDLLGIAKVNDEILKIKTFLKD